MDQPQLSKRGNLRIQSFVYGSIVGYRTKKFIAEEVICFSATMKSLLAEYMRTKPEQRSDYLMSYTEFRYLQIIGTFHKLV
jgi:hypothetical protein